MAAIGDLIAKENFSTSWAKNWSDSHSNKDQKRYVYICAPAWYIVGSASYFVLGGSGIFQIYVSYWNGSSWSDEWHYEVNSSGDTGGVTKRIGHNRDEGNLTAGLHNAYPLWKVRYWPSRSNDRWSINVYAGGWGVAKDTGGNFLNYPQNELIYSRGRVGDPIHSSGTTEDDSNVLANVFNPTNRRGSPILASNDSELVSYPYLA